MAAVQTRGTEGPPPATPFRNRQDPDKPLPEQERPEALEQLLELALDLCDADSGSMMVMDPSGRELRVVVSRGLRLKPGETPRIKVGDRIAGRIAETGRPVLVRSDASDPRWQPFLTRRNEIRAAACVPCRDNGRINGVLTVNQRWRSDVDLDEADLKRLQALADYVGPKLGRVLAVSPATDTVESRWIADPAAQARIDRLANLGVVAGGIAHEINNPLQGALGIAEILLELHDKQTPEEHLRDLTSLRNDLYRLSEIVTTLLSFVRDSDTAAPVTTDIQGAMEFAAASAVAQSATARIRCRRDYAPSLPPVRMRPAQLRQVLLNLTVNAVQAMGEQGELQVGARRTPEGDFVELTVSDTGPGIPPAALAHIFEPGFTTKSDGEGTGLGLAVSRRLVRDQGGDLTVESTPGHGATFTVRVPVATKAEEPPLFA